MTTPEQRRDLYAAYCDCLVNREKLTPNGIVDRLLRGLAAIVEDARNDEREGIACYLEAQGHPQLAGGVFAGMTRPVNDERRNAAIDAREQGRPPKKRSSRKASATEQSAPQNA